MTEERKKQPVNANEVTPNPKPTLTPENIPTKKTVPYSSSVLIYFIIALVEILLLFRFVFKLSGADPASGFVSFIYNLTNFLVAPYSVFVFEPGTLIAMLVYAFLAWAIAKIIGIIAKRLHNE
jgi:hypothetical protein